MSRNRVDQMAARLRENAANHTTVLSLKADLPAYPEEGAEEAGLYAEGGTVPGMVINGELRISALRLYSVDDQGERKLVGQVQAVRVLDHPLQQWELRFYVHVPKVYSTHRVDDQEEWFVRVLEEHYKDGGDQVALEPQVPA